MLLFFNVENLSQPNEYEQSLAKEYWTIIQKEDSFSNLDKKRLIEITEIASSEELYSYLRYFIATTHFLNLPQRKPFSENIYKNLLEPNFGNRAGTDTLNLAIFYLASGNEKQYENILEEKLISLAAMDDFAKLQLSSFYYLGGDSDKALDALPMIEKRLLGLFLELKNEKLFVTEVSDNSVVASLKPGDKLLLIEKTNIGSIYDIQNELNKYKTGKSLSLTYERDEKIETLRFNNPESILDFQLAPFRAQILASLMQTDEALALIKQFEKFDYSEVNKNAIYFDSLIAVNNYVKCSINLEPLTKNTEIRKQGVEFCKQSLDKMAKAFSLIDNFYYQFELSLVSNNNFLYIAHAHAASLIAAAYMSDYYPAFPKTYENPDTYKALDFLKKSPLTTTFEEGHLLALVEIYGKGKVKLSEQYESLTDERLKFLENSAENDDYTGYLSRFELYKIYRWDNQRKDNQKAFFYAQKMNELDSDRDPINSKLFIADSYYFKKDYQNFFLYGFDLFGKFESFDKKIIYAVFDELTDIDTLSLNKLLDDEFTKSLLNKKNLYPYLVTRSYYEMAPFNNKDDITCKIVQDDENIKENYLSQAMYSMCYLDGQIDSDESYVKSMLSNLSNRGSSSATLMLSIIDYEINSSDYSSQKNNLEFAKKQLDAKTSRKLVKDLNWYEGDTGLFLDAPRQIIDDELSLVNSKIKEEQDYILALQRAKDREERARLQTMRKETRKERAEKAGGFFKDFITFTAKAALVVGAVALTGEALENASPETQQSFIDSISGSSYNSYSGYAASKNNSSQCRSAKSDLSRARKAVTAASTNMMGNLQCNNVRSCLTPLPRQCSNRAFSCRAGDYACTARENQNYINCTQRSRQAAENAKKSCEWKRNQEIKQCNQKINNDSQTKANAKLKIAQSAVDFYCN